MQQMERVFFRVLRHMRLRMKCASSSPVLHFCHAAVSEK